MDIGSLKRDQLSRISPQLLGLGDGNAIQEHLRRRYSFVPAAAFFNARFLEVLGPRAETQEQYDWLLDRRAEAAQLIQQLAGQEGK
jgi:hypothetical protein